MRLLGLIFGHFVLFGRWARWACVGIALAACSEGRPAAPLVMRDDTVLALHEASLRHAPAVVMYAAPWCASCGAMQKTFADVQVRRALTAMDAVVIAVTLDSAGHALTQVPEALSPAALGITGVPVLVCIDRAQTPHAQTMLVGYVGPRRLLEWLQGCADAHPRPV